jgi:ABC-2 type transport system permease protein
MLFPFPGWLAKAGNSRLQFEPLITTGPSKTGVIAQKNILRQTPYGMDINDQRTYKRQPRPYVLAARIKGEGHAPAVRAVLVADVDILSPAFLQIREEAGGLEEGINFDLDNVTFALNVIDSLAGDYRFVDMRNHRPKHRILTRVEQRTENARGATAEARERFYEECANNVKRESETLQAKILAIQKELRSRKMVDMQELAAELGAATAEFEGRKEEKKKEFERIRDQEVSKSETELAQQIRRVQDQCKIWAVMLPPIPPLIVAAIVFFTRRVREREGIARSRLR